MTPLSPGFLLPEMGMMRPAEGAGRSLRQFQKKMWAAHRQCPAHRRTLIAA